MRHYLVNRERRNIIIDQLFDQVRQKLTDLDPHINGSNTEYMLRKFHNFTFNLEDPQNPGEKREVFIPVSKFAKKARQVPSNVKDFTVPGWTGFNSGILLHGKKGTGKSGTLMYIATWAYANDWILLVSPGGYGICQDWDKWDVRRHSETGVYMHIELTQEYLKGFKKTNAHLIYDIPVNQEIYGKYNASGCRADEPPIYEPEYIKERQTMSNTWESWLDEQDLKDEAVE